VTMRRGFAGLAIASIVVVGIAFLGLVPQAKTETLTVKSFSHVTKAEMFPVGDVEGHAISVLVREGVTVFQNGEWAWMKGTYIRDLVRGAGPGDSYITLTFLDGSTITVRRKGMMEATLEGVTSGTNGPVNLFRERADSKESRERTRLHRRYFLLKKVGCGKRSYPRNHDLYSAGQVIR